MLRFVGLMGLVLLCGCREELWHDRSEDEANSMVRVLRLRSLDAWKVPQQGEGGLYTVTIPKAELLEASNVLHLNGLPRSRSAKTESGAVSSILPNQRLDDELALRAHASEIDRALLSLEGVLDSHVVLSMRVSDEAGLLGNEPTPRAALVLTCRATESGRCLLAENDARGVLMSALPGLTEANTYVLMQAVTPPPSIAQPQLVSIFGFPVLASAAQSLRALIASLCIVIVGLMGVSAALVLRRTQRARAARRSF